MNKLQNNESCSKKYYKFKHILSITQFFLFKLINCQGLHETFYRPRKLKDRRRGKTSITLHRNKLGQNFFEQHPDRPNMKIWHHR